MPAAAGWFADPSGKPQERFWDGSAWTEQVRPYPSPDAPQQQEPQKAVPVDAAKPPKSFPTWAKIAIGVGASLGVLLFVFLLVNANQSPPVPDSFDAVDEVVAALEDRGIECPGTESVGPLQRSCSDTFAITVWPSEQTAKARAQGNVQDLESIGIECQFIVIRNALLSNKALDPKQLDDLEPSIYRCEP